MQIIDTTLTAVSDISKLITKALPSDEQQLAAFKIRSPRIYANIRTRMIKGFIRFCKKNYSRYKDFNVNGDGGFQAVRDYVRACTYNLPESEQWLFVNAVCAALNN